MCEPTTLATVASLAMGVVGMGMQAKAKKQEIEAQNQAAEYNAQIAEQNIEIAEYNAQMQEQQATNAEQRGALEEKQHRLRVSQLKGKQRSSFAGMGVRVDEGSSLDTLQDTAEYAELDALTMRYNTQMEAWGHRTGAQNTRLEGSIFQKRADLSRSQKRSPGLAVGSTLLTSGSQLFKTYF